MLLVVVKNCRPYPIFILLRQSQPADFESRSPKIQRMKNYLRRGSLILAVCIVAILARAAPTWQRLDTDDFTIYSDASANDIREFAVNYTAFRQVLGDLFLPAGHKPTRSTLILFKRGSSLKKYGPIAKDDDFTLLTFTAQVDDSALLALAISGDQKHSCELAFEFETIFALQRAGYFLPTWMTQGTGMVMASLEVENKVCRIGADIDDRTEFFLKSGNQLPWDKFFLTGRDSDEYKGKKHAGVFQAQAWALMHWILLSKQHPRDSFATLAACIREKSFLEAAEDTTGVKAKEFTDSITRHLNGRAQDYECSFDAQKVRARLQLSPAPEAEVHVQLANILAAAGRYDEASNELNQALALAPEAVCVEEAAARQALRHQQEDDAVKLYRAAIAAGTKNPIAYLVSADARLDEYASSRIDYAGGGGPSTETAISEIKKALELNPSNMQAYRLLGRAFYILPKFTEEQLAELTPALVNGADGCSVRYYRALLYERLEKLDQCIGDLRLIVDDPDALQWNKRAAQDRLTRFDKKLKDNAHR
jgi:tetratricopeptide (TPR) repeat protein